MSWLVLLLGLGAGALTTVAGFGGGLLLVLPLSAVADPRTALAITAPALLAGNLHRIWLLRAGIDWATALRFGAGAVPAAVVGGLLTVTLPDVVLSWLLLATAAFAVARELGWARWQPSARALVPAGAGTGLLTATTGTGGLLLAPVLLATGLRGERFVATGAVIASAIHVTRIGTYGAGGMLDTGTLLASLLLAGGIVAGNLLGTRLRRVVTEATTMRVTWATLAVAMAFALLGVG